MIQEKERLVVTGKGMVTALGHNVRDTWENLIAGKSGIRRISHLEGRKRVGAINSQVDIAAIVENFDPLKIIPANILRRVHRSAQFSSAATLEALIDAGLWGGENLVDVLSEDIGMCMGTGIGGGSEIAEIEGVIIESGDRRISQYSMLNLLADRLVAVPSEIFKFKGPTSTKNEACASAGGAICDGARILKCNEAKVMVVGGAEAALHRVSIGSFNAMGALSRKNSYPTRASRPFDRDATGFVMGEGCGVLILETESYALARGARIYAELAGYGESSDAFHDTMPSGEGAARAMRLALFRAGLNPEDVDYINAHGTSTGLARGDGKEISALQDVFGKSLRKIPISSTKSMLAHTLGAAGAIESIVCIQTIVNNVIHPTLNLHHSIARDLDFVPNIARARVVNVAMNNTNGFGGFNACLIFKKYERR